MKAKHLLPIIVLLGIALRILSSFSELWLDEIWSLEGAKRLTSPFHLLSDFRSDNNHPLTTAWFYLVGTTTQWWIYRLPSIFAGICSLFFVYVLMRPKGEVASVIALFLTSFSFLLVLYDSEARGYGLLVALSLGSLLTLKRFEREGRGGAVFSLLASLGPFTHLLYLQFFTALVARSVFMLFLRKLSVASLAKLYTFPSFVIAALYWFHIRELPGGTGPLRSQLQTILDSASITFGGPTISMYATETITAVLTLAIVWVGLLITGIRSIRDKEEKFFYLSVIVIAPLLFLLAEPRVIFPRYFLLSIVFFYLLLAEFSAILWKRGLGAQVVVILGLGGFLVGNFFYLMPLVTVGRGEYTEVLQELSSDADPTVSGDHDGRNRSIVQFFNDVEGLNARYIVTEDKDRVTTKWYLSHTQDLYCEPPEVLQKGDLSYILKRTTSYAGQSGWRWFLYERQERRIEPQEKTARKCRETRQK